MGFITDAITGGNKNQFQASAPVNQFQAQAPGWTGGTQETLGGATNPYSDPAWTEQQFQQATANSSPMIRDMLGPTIKAQIEAQRQQKEKEFSAQHPGTPAQKLDYTSYADAIGQALQGAGSTSAADATAGQQNALAQMLMAQAQGQGPNPALAQLQQTTAQNINQTAGGIASQRGLNPALAARMVQDTGAGINQQAAGQAATLSAQQQLAAAGQLGSTLSAQRGQDIAQQQAMQQLLGTAGGLQQGQNVLAQQGSLAAQQLNAATAAQNAQLNLGAQGINAGVASQNAQANQQILGGIMGGAGAALGLLNKGGEVPAFADGGQIWSPGGWTSEPDPYSIGAQPGPWATGEAPMAPSTSPKSGGPASYIGKILTGFSRGMRGFSEGTLASEGGKVPGKAKVKGDSPKNDTVYNAVSPGEGVIPRSHMQSPELAHAFVEQLFKGYDEGGLVGAFTSWLKGNKGAESTDEDVRPEARGAEEISKHLPKAVMPRSAIERKRKQLHDLDVQTRE